MSELIYDAELDLTCPTDARVMAVRLVGSSKRVLEFGCSTGRVTEALANQGCRVTGIELDPDAAERARSFADEVFVADLDFELDELESKLAGQQWEVALFGDVLEHLRDPLRALRAARRLLISEGTLVVSIPNIAHADIRLALLRGTFPYGPFGLLDNTHLRFFTLDTARRLLSDAGFVMVDLERKMIPAFGSELALQRSDFPAAIVDEVLSDPEAEVYQFVMRAVVDNGAAQVGELATRCLDLETQLQRALVAREIAIADALECAAAAESKLREFEHAWTELKALKATKLMRYSNRGRRAYARLFRRRSA